MKRTWLAGLVVVLVTSAFLAGAWVSWQAASRGRDVASRKVLYFVDPMHPSYKSDKPGIAPDCGMQLEPVYADGAPPASGAAVPAGALKVSAEKQQAIGVTIGVTARSPLRRTLRTVGRVVPDENRVFRLVTAIDGWVKEVYAGQTGAVVEKNQLLLTFYSREFLAAQGSYFYALDARDRFRSEGRESANQLGSLESQIRTAAETLQALGMDDIQLAEIAKTRKAASSIALRSPTAGMVVARNVFARQRFDRATELYRIADISRVLVLAEVFEGDAQYVGPGAIAQVSFPYQRNRPIKARVSETLPQFDPATRTLKLRLEADNPEYLLRPDMLVDVGLDITLPDAVTVPTEAVVDSGGRKTVYVDRGNGYFEARRVETGWRVDDRVEIVKGLMAGERIVLSGNFLLDSESRMKMTAMGISVPDTDPVCGMEVDQQKARGAGRVASYRGQSYSFCSDDCQHRFEKAPAQYVRDSQPLPSAPVAAVWRRIPTAAGTAPARVDDDDERPDAEAFPQMLRARPGMSRMSRPRNLPASDQVVDARLPAATPAEPAGETAPRVPSAGGKAASMDPACRITVDEESATAAGLTLTVNAKTYYFVSKDCRDRFAKQPDLYAEAAPPKKDPVCGNDVFEETAVAAGLTSTYQGNMYFFGATGCKEKFDADPTKFVKK
ncbi:MAG: efflux RND transporter periplasmic adaptor subunit [Acidobacteriota bacterium]